MNLENEKFVIVIDEELPLGIIANTAAIIGITLDKEMPETVGESVLDKNNYSHLGIIEFPVPILKADKEKIKEIRTKLYDEKFKDVVTVDFSDVAQSCKTYEEFIGKIKLVDEKDLTYFGIGMCGPKKLVNKLTGSLPLLR